MAGDLFIGVLQMLFFTVFAGFFLMGNFALGGDDPIYDNYQATFDIFCGFLKTIIFFFAKLTFEIFGDMFAEIEAYYLKLVVFFKCGGTIGLETKLYLFFEFDATFPLDP